MLVVIGLPRLARSGGDAAADGLAVQIAGAGVADGARVEFVGKIGDDPAGDALLLAMAGVGIGHVATLRDPARATPVSIVRDEPVDPADPADDEVGDPGDAVDSAVPWLEPADVGLALRYVTDFRVVVAVHPPPGVLAEAVAAANWAEAHLIVVVASDDEQRTGLPEGSLVVAAADDGGTGVGAAIGRYAAAVDRGDDPADVYAALLAAGTA